MTPIRVIIVDDHEAVRQGLRWMLRLDERVEVVGEAADGNELLAVLAHTRCDVILLDLWMPGMSGIDVLTALRASGRSVPVVVLTMHDDAAHVDHALGLGASGYVLKSASSREMLLAITAAVEGGVYVQPSLAKPLLARYVIPADQPAVGPSIHLSPRQLQLLRALASGRSNKELARDLGLSEGTVKSYLKDLYERLGVTSRAGAVAYGMRHGLIR